MFLVRRYWFIAPAALASLAWAWIAIASLVFLLVTGRSGFTFPFDQIVPAAMERLTYGIHSLEDFHATTGIFMGAGVASLLLVAVVRMAWRGRSRLNAPIGGGVRPVIRGATNNYGNATILPNPECLLRFPGPEGIVIGELREGPAGTAPLVIDPVTTDAGNGLFVAGNGAGKSTSLATMAMHWNGSAVILDTKVELAQMLSEALRADGKRVHVISLTNPESGFNVIGWINPAKPLASLDVRNCVTWIFPDDKEDAKRDPYFEPTGRALCAVILADLIWSDIPKERKTLATFRERLTTPEDRMKQALAAIAKDSKSSYAKQVARTLVKITSKQWSGVYGQATVNTEWLSDPDLSQLVSGTGFPVSDILDGNTFIFAQLPLKTVTQVPGLGRVIIGSLLNAVYDAEGKIPRRVGFFLDEAWVLKQMQVQKSATVTGRSFGITLVWFYQSTGQIEETWGNQVSTLYNNLSWRAYAAVKDRKLAQEISEDFGEMSVIAWSEGDNQGTQRPPGFGLASRSSGKTSNKSEIKRRILLPQEITSADPTDMFVIAGNVNMRLRTPMSHLRPEFDGVVKPSPHYRPKQDAEVGLIPFVSVITPIATAIGKVRH